MVLDEESLSPIGKTKSSNELLEIYEIPKERIERNPSQQFSNLFNAYAQAINKQNNRHGSLFEKPFRRKKILDEKYLLNIILFIHNNPVQHSITNSIEDYKWSSYHGFLNNKISTPQKDEVLNLFEDKDNFVHVHKQKIKNEGLEKWLRI